MDLNQRNGFRSTLEPIDHWILRIVINMISSSFKRFISVHVTPTRAMFVWGMREIIVLVNFPIQFRLTYGQRRYWCSNENNNVTPKSGTLPYPHKYPDAIRFSRLLNTMSKLNYILFFIWFKLIIKPWPQNVSEESEYPSCSAWPSYSPIPSS